MWAIKKSCGASPGWCILSVLFLILIPTSLHAQEGRVNNSLEINPDALHFLVVGDWGQGNKRQRDVAAQMAVIAEKVGVDFIITTGDNFYPSGVTSERDPLWTSVFEKVYGAPSLQVPWYPVLGNHDYGGDPDAQVRYSEKSKRWKMPSRFYQNTVPLQDDTTRKVMFVFIDTTPLIRSNYGRGMAVTGQDTTAQLNWIKNTLSNVSADVKWTFVIGHHPVYTAGERRDNLETFEARQVLQPLFERYDVSAYLAGHEHNLQHLTGADGLQQFISGGGSEARRIKPFAPRRFTRAASGFILFSVLETKAVVQIINRQGKILYRYHISPDRNR